MTLRNVLLTAHILVALVTIGWLAAQSMLIPRAIRTGNAAAVRFSIAAAEKLGPTAITVFLLGVWLVVRQKDDYAEFRYTWVSASMTLFILALLNGSVLIARAERAAAAKLEAGQDARAEASRVAMLGGINMLMLIAIVYLMVAKPGVA
ncbi:MAG TPA: DUF2269 family protein [Frankiaceae bacterium]|jgi:uncharacterized membrane protein|nr:DUF2269 family protein [Frankiaceae bacterium]